MHPVVSRMYGRPKLIELLIIKSPGKTMRDLLTPSGVIFSFVDVIYFEPIGASPILIQFTPSLFSVKKLEIGLGDPPRSISIMSPSRFLTTDLSSYNGENKLAKIDVRSSEKRLSLRLLSLSQGFVFGH